VRHQEKFFGYPEKGIAPDKSKVVADISWSIKEIERSKRAMNKLPKKGNE
jgi:hypothetical protein